MFRWLCIFLLACTPLAHAAPQAGAPDEVERVVTDKGLLNRLEDVSHRVADKAHTVADQASTLVGNAMGFLGIPYKRGGSRPTVCSYMARTKPLQSKPVSALVPPRL